MSRRALWGIAILMSLATLALMLYSLDRTAWLFTLYETGRPNAELLGYVAAVVMELAAVGLIASEGAAEALPIDENSRKVLRAWAQRGLVMVLATQAVANLVVGFLRGGAALRRELMAIGPDEGWQYLALGGVIWLLANGLIPALIFGFSKMQARIFRLLISQETTIDASGRVVVSSTLPQAPAPVASAQVTEEMPADTLRVASSAAPTYQRILELVEDNPALPTKWLAEQLNRSERTAKVRVSEMVRMGMLRESGGYYVRNGSTALIASEEAAN